MAELLGALFGSILGATFLWFVTTTILGKIISKPMKRYMISIITNALIYLLLLYFNAVVKDYWPLYMIGYLFWIVKDYFTIKKQINANNL